DICGCTALLGWYTRSKNIAIHPFKRIDKSIVSFLNPCSCSGRFTASAEPRCPTCLHHLSAVKATSWIEANAPGSAKGWRWQGNWENDLYCIIVEGKSVADPWK